MPIWTILNLEDSDLAACSDINIAAFGDSNNFHSKSLFTSCQPAQNDWTQEERTASERRRFRHVYEGIAAKAVTEDSSIGGFAAWLVQQPKTTEEVLQQCTSTPPPEDPEIDPEAKSRYQNWLFPHLQRIMAGKTHWLLDVIATNPSHLRQGVASALIQWGLEQAAKEGLPTILAAAPHAVPVYEKNGLSIAEKVTVDYDAKDAQGKVLESRTIELVIMTKSA